MEAKNMKALEPNELMGKYKAILLESSTPVFEDIKRWLAHRGIVLTWSVDTNTCRNKKLFGIELTQSTPSSATGDIKLNYAIKESEFTEPLESGHRDLGLRVLEAMEDIVAKHASKNADPDPAAMQVEYSFTSLNTNHTVKGRVMATFSEEDYLTFTYQAENYPTTYLQKVVKTNGGAVKAAHEEAAKRLLRDLTTLADNYTPPFDPVEYLTAQGYYTTLGHG